MAFFTLAILGVGIYFATRYLNAKQEVNVQKATATVPVVDIDPHSTERVFEAAAWQLLSQSLEGNFDPRDLYAVMQEREVYLRSRFEEASAQASKAYEMLILSLQAIVLHLGKVGKGCKALRKNTLRQKLLSQARKAIAGDAIQDFFELSMGNSPVTFADGLKKFVDGLETSDASATRIAEFHQAYAILCGRLEVYKQRNDWKKVCHTDWAAYETFLTNNIIVSMVLPNQ